MIRPIRQDRSGPIRFVSTCKEGMEMTEIHKCEGSVSGSWSTAPCGKTAKYEIDGTTGSHYSSEYPPRTVHLCGTHKRVLDQRGSLSIAYPSKNGYRGMAIVQFQANDRSAYDEKVRQERYDAARMSAHRRVMDAESAISFIIRSKAIDLAAMIVDGIPLDAAVAHELRIELVEARKAISAARTEYERIKAMTPDEYANV